MAITIVGTPQTGTAVFGADLTLTFDVTPSQNDIVVVFGGSSRFRTPDPTAPGTGYTQIALNTTTTFMGAWYKRMGASPDSSVLCQGSANANDTTGYGCYVLRGIDTTTALDVTATTAGLTTSTNPNPALITSVTDDAMICVFAGSEVNDATPGTVSGYSNQITATNSGVFNWTIAGATLIKTTAGAENPPAWSSWGNGAWYAITAAFRPAAVSASTGNFFLLF